MHTSRVYFGMKPDETRFSPCWLTSQTAPSLWCSQRSESTVHGTVLCRVHFYPTLSSCTWPEFVLFALLYNGEEEESSDPTNTLQKKETLSHQWNASTSEERSSKRDINFISQQKNTHDTPSWGHVTCHKCSYWAYIIYILTHHLHPGEHDNTAEKGENYIMFQTHVHITHWGHSSAETTFSNEGDGIIQRCQCCGTSWKDWKFEGEGVSMWWGALLYPDIWNTTGDVCHLQRSKQWVR